jgi:hypothetical protein
MIGFVENKLGCYERTLILLTQFVQLKKVKKAKNLELLYKTS